MAPAPMPVPHIDLCKVVIRGISSRRPHIKASNAASQATTDSVESAAGPVRRSLQGPRRGSLPSTRRRVRSGPPRNPLRSAPSCPPSRRLWTRR